MITTNAAITARPAQIGSDIGGRFVVGIVAQSSFV
jgi:hypothetical protein